MTFLQNTKLSIKLPLVIGAAMLLLAGAGLLGIYQLDQSVATYARVLAVDRAQERLANHILVDLKTQVQEWKNTLLRGKDAKQLDKYWSAFQKHEGEVIASARKLQAALPEGEAHALVTKFTLAHAAMGVGYRKGFEAFRAANFEPAAGDSAVKGMDRAPAEVLEQVGRTIEASSTAAVAVAHEASQRATALSIGLMFAVCALATLGACIITGAVTRPIIRALQVAQAVAAGDLTSDIKVTGKDETGQLLAALKLMNTSLVGIVSNVRQSSDSVATGSAQIATGNADLSQRTEEQASSLQQTAASMEQLTSTVKQNSDAARQASRLATIASEAAAKGGVVVGHVVHTMQAITTSSKKISDIISVIDSIAFQTNILALNAAVEAARAGEQGRGFSVVAAEVRSLAQRSADAAKEIKTLIGESVERVETGSKLVGEAGRSMEDIVDQVRRVTELIAEISSASMEQTQGIGRVGDAVNQLDQATQENAALVEESAAAAESLSQQAARLAEVVSVFKLSAGDCNEAPHAASDPAGLERRGPNRASNVTRPRFATRPAPARLQSSNEAAAPAASTRTGSDDWTSF